MIRSLYNLWLLRRINKRINRLFAVWRHALDQGDTATAIEADGLVLRLLDQSGKLIAENKRHMAAARRRFA